MFDDVTLVVLSGGRGRRLGLGEKAFVPVAGRPMILRVLDLHERFADVMIVGAPTPDLEALGVPVHPDLIPGAGAPGGLHAGLSRCTTPWACVLACDMPLVNPRVLQALYEVRDGHDAVVPEAGGRRHPLHAFYRVATVAEAARRTAGAGGSLHALLDALDVRYQPIDDPDSVANVNRPEDLAAIEARFRP